METSDTIQQQNASQEGLIVNFPDLTNQNMAPNESGQRDVTPYIEAIIENGGFDFDNSPNLKMTISWLLTDFYQLTMAHTYFDAGRHELHSVFEMYFRKCPFSGQYVVFAGLDRVVDVFKSLKFSQKDVDKILRIFESKEIEVADGFADYLLNLDLSQVKVSAVKHGEIVYGKVPVITIEGPLIIGQLLETLLLVLVSYPSLVATYARRLVNSAKGRPVIEFGLRRAQGPGSAYDASKYSQVGGCDGTSNVACGVDNDIRIIGTIAHSFVTSYKTLDQVKDREIVNKKTGQSTILFKRLVLDIMVEIGYAQIVNGELKLLTNEGELAAFIQYGMTNSRAYAGLLDTYDTLTSGTRNYIAVAVALHRLGFTPFGVRLDSGDLGYLSIEVKKEFERVDELLGIDFLKHNKVFVSNELSEEVIEELFKNGHAIDIFCVGTNLVTCKKTPSLGMVYKLVWVDNEPCMKFSQDDEKITFPFKKFPYRFYHKGTSVVDIMLLKDDINSYVLNGKLLCKHPTDSKKEATIDLTNPEITYERLHHVIWNNGVATTEDLSISVAKQYCAERFCTVRDDHKRLINPTPYKVSVTNDIFSYIEEQIKEHNKTATIG